MAESTVSLFVVNDWQIRLLLVVNTVVVLGLVWYRYRVLRFLLVNIVAVLCITVAWSRFNF